MWRFCLWMVAAIGLWIGGLVIVPPHREIRTVEDGRPVIRVTMASPGATTWGAVDAFGGCGGAGVRGEIYFRISRIAFNSRRT